MVKINLLPEEFRLRKRKLRISARLAYVVAAVGGVFLILLFLTLWQKSRLGQMENEIRQTRVEAERQKADLELVRELTVLKESLLQRMKVVEELNQSRTRWIDILTALSQSLPEDLWLVSLKENITGQEHQAQVQGMSFSLKPIALFMDSLDETQWFSRPRFTYAHRLAVPEGMAYNFEIVADLFSYQREIIAQQSSTEEKDLKGKKGQKKGQKKKG